MAAPDSVALPAEWRLELGDVDLRAMAAALDEEIERGLRDEPGRDLALLPAYVGLPRAGARGRVLCLDAGGTHVRGAVVAVDAQGATVGEVRHAPLPGTQGVVDRDEFFEELACLLAPDAARLRRIGFCFSYPAEVRPDGDAVLLRWTKEIEAAGVEGARVGQGLCAGLERLGRRGPFRVVVLNDTVTTLIAATRDPQTAGCAGFVGLVVGTGTNMAGFEPAARARRRAPRWRGGPLAFNLESGNFRRFPRGTLDERLAAATHDPDRQWLEKAVSGQYLGDLCHLALGDLAAGGASAAPGRAAPELGRAAVELGPPTARAMSRIIAGASPESPWEEWVDAHPAARAPVRAVMRALVTRSARLVAGGLACMVGRAAAAAPKPGAAVAVAAEGSAFWGLPRYRDIVVETLGRLTPTPVTLVRIADANLRGAALAALGRRA
jgi:hexokinase